MSRVLLVNDSRFESLVIKDMLMDMGHSVVISDEFEAMEKAAGCKPDYAIINNIMRNVTGDLMIAMLKIEQPGVKCLLFSNNPLNIESFRYRKVDACFRTPVDPPGLRQALEQADKKVGGVPSPSPVISAMYTMTTTGSQPPSADRIPVPKAPPAREFCPNCGNRIGSGDDERFSFCPYCGKRVIS